MAVAAEFFKRCAIAPESSFKTAGSFKQIQGLQRPSTFEAGREALARADAYDSRGRNFAAIPGEQTYSASVQVDLHGLSNANLIDLLTGAVGARQADSSLTLGVGSTASSLVISSGTPRAIVQVTGSDSKIYYCAVLSFSGGNAAIFPDLPTGITPSAAKNLSEVAGDSYLYTLGTDAPTYTIESDWSARPNTSGDSQRVILAKGCAVNAFTLNLSTALIGLTFGFIGAEYDRSGGAASNISDPTPATSHYVPRKGDVFLTTDSGAAWDDPTTPVIRLAATLTAPLVVETGTKGLDGGSSGSSMTPGSSITGYTRNPAEIDLEIVVPYSEAHEDAYEAGTVYKLFGVWYPGSPHVASIPANRLIFYAGQMVQTAAPQEVIEEGAKRHRLLFRLEDASTSQPTQSVYALGLVDVA